MNTYEIAAVEGEYQVIQTSSDGRQTFIGRFSSHAEAQAWLDNHLRQLGDTGETPVV
jgi:hypothetical protein